MDKAELDEWPLATIRAAVSGAFPSVDIGRMYVEIDVQGGASR